MPDRTAGAVLLAGLCLLSGYAAGSSPVPIPHAHQSSGAEVADQPRSKDSPEKTFWQRLTTDPNAVFTMILALVGGGQILFLRRADQVSRDAALAARVSADAASRALENLALTERAVVAVRIADHNLVAAVASGEASATFGEARAEPVAISYVVKNYGKTPGFIESLTHNLTLDLGETVPKRAMSAPSLSVAMLAAGDETHAIQPALDMSLDANNSAAIQTGQVYIWLTVSTTVRDIFGAKWESTNMWRYGGSPNMLRNYGTQHRQVEFG